ncbi:MAG TPA: hypothetical protein VHV30_13330 [Polyangiaceae bacterium]|jgi:hypothetical protein|nr:hypothetical protein [Polyangiaceae bacterium]
MASVIALAIAGAGCGGHAPNPQAADHALVTRSTGSGRPPLAVVVREGDARGALAIAVTTAGIAEERGAIAGVALAALVEARLAARGVEVSAVGGWDGWRLRALVASPADAARVIDAVRAALLAPVDPHEPALAAVARKAAALARRPLPDPALIDAARCTGEAYAAGDATNAGDVSAADLEAWRAAAHGLGRVAIATVGDAALADATAVTLERAPAWPRAADIPASPWPAPQAPSLVYAASGELPPGAARVVITARTASPERAVAAAPALGDPGGPLASRLAALDAPARVRSVTAAAHVDGGCVAATIDLAARDLKADAAARIATAAALARQEVAVEIADGAAPADLGREVAQRAADPRDAAERAAWWSLAGRRADASDEDPVMAVAVGVAARRDAPADASAPAGGPDAIRAAIDRATQAWRAPVIETRTRVERGQGETWILLASPCGTASESTGNAGIAAAVALAAAAQAAEAADDARVEPFVDAAGVGLLVHGPARPGESAQALARRLGDYAARALAADEIAPAHATLARTTLIARASESSARALGGLAAAVAPGHPSWVAPEGTLFGLSSLSDDAIAARAASIRSGPMRLAVIANVDAAQADAAARAVDRWIARRPGEARTCPAAGSAQPPREGTYAVDVAPGAPSEVLLGAPLPPGDAGARASAAWIAAALDGGDGLLARALGGNAGAPPLAQTWSATVLGAPQAPVLVVRVTGADASMDGAVAQVRGLLDRVRQGALRDEDRARAAANLGRDRLAASLDPRARVVDLWRGDPVPMSSPSIDDLRAFAAATLRDDRLVIVAGRPPRTPPDSPRSRRGDQGSKGETRAR